MSRPHLERRKLSTRKNRGNYEEFLNNLGVPNSDKRSYGGRILDTAKYGSWLRKNDPIAFEVGLNDWHGNYKN